MTESRIKDFTVRMWRKDKRPFTRKQAQAALWAAHKIVQKGGSAVDQLRDWHIEGIDWVNVRRSGTERTYHYDAERVDEILGALGGVFEKVGMAGLRVGRP